MRETFACWHCSPGTLAMSDSSQETTEGLPSSDGLDSSTQHANGDCLAERMGELQFENQLFSCASCGEGSTDHSGDEVKSKAPTVSLRLLSCLHSVCRSCLISCCARGDGTASCPSCMEITRLPAIGWVDALPRTYWCFGRDEGQPEKQATPALECAECGETEPGEGVVGGCLDCKELFCSVHWQAHAKSRKTKGHTMSKSVDGFSSQATPGLQTTSSRVPCSMHTDHEATGYCNTCKQLICDVCVERNHLRHDIDREFMDAKEKRRRLSDAMEKSDGGVEKCKASITLLNATIAEVNDEAAQASKEVNEHVESLIDELTKEQKATLHEIDEARWSLQKELEKILERKKAALSQLERSRFLAQACLDGKTNDAQLIHLFNTLQENIGQGNTECSGKVDLTGLPLPVSVNKPSELLAGKVRSFHFKLRGKEFHAEPPEDQCQWELQAENFCRPTIHQRSSRHIEHLASSPESKSAAAGNLCAVIESPSGEVEACDLYTCVCQGGATQKLPQNWQGNVDVDFDAKMPGLHKLHVTCNGRHVRGSPCEVQVSGCPFGEKVSLHIDHDRDQGRPTPLTHMSARSVSSYLAFKFGVFIPKAPQLADAKRSCKVGVQLFGSEHSQQENPVRLNAYHWRSDGLFDAEEAQEHRPEIKGPAHVWEDEEVMQVELCYVDGRKWKLKITYLNSGSSSEATFCEKDSCETVAALAIYPDKSPAYLLPAFF